MSKLKTVEFKRMEVETDLEYPVYLYFQDEMCYDEYRKIESDKITILKSNYRGFEISVEHSDGCINPHHLRSRTKKEHYDAFLEELIKKI